jgi:hypothetical protein
VTTRPVLVLLLMLAVSSVACGVGSGSSDEGSSSTPAPTSGDSRPSVPAATEQMRPAGCTLPTARLDSAVDVPLLYGMADETSVSDTRFVLLTATPTADSVTLEVRRTSGDCVGSATVEVEPGEPVAVLGMVLTSSAPFADAATPNRARVTLKVTGGDQ